jgi:hypothetical protein
MRNKAFRINGKQGIVRFGQFGNGPLPNWILNTHPYMRAFRTQGMKLPGLLL